MSQFQLPQAPALQPTSVGVDSFVRPRESTSGRQLAELANTLSNIRPEIGQYLNAGVENYEAQESAQGQRWALKNMSISAGDFKTATAGWSVPRILAASQSLAQHSADDYSLELNQALVNAAKDGKPLSPDQVNGISQPIRDKYMQDGTAFGPLWAKTFAEYAAHYETGATHNYLSQVLDEQGRQAVSNATSDVATEATALLTVPGDYQQNFTKWMADFFDPSHLHSPISPTQKSQAIVEGFRGAVVHALANQQFDIADHLIDGFQNIEVFPGAKISATAQGSDALQDMLRQSHYARVSANETDSLQRRANQSSISMEVQKFIESQQKLAPSARQMNLPDDLLERAIGADMNPQELQSRYEFFMKAPERQGREAAASDVDRIKSSAAGAWNHYFLTRTSDAFHTLQSTLTQLTKDPGAGSQQAQEYLKESLGAAWKEYDARYSDGAQDSSKVVTHAVSTFNTDMSSQMRELDNTLRNTDGSVLPKVLRNIPEISQVTDAAGNVRYEASDLLAQARDELNQRIHDMGPDAWQDTAKVNAAKTEVFNAFKDKLHALTEHAKQTINDTDPPEKPVSMMGTDGTPSNSMVSSILSSRSMADDGAPGRTWGAFMTAPINEAGSVIQRGHFEGTFPFGDLSVLPLQALRDPNWTGAESQTRLTLAQDIARKNLMDSFQTTTAGLLKFEKDNAALLKKVADAGGAIPGEDDIESRAKLVQWAKARDTWRSLANRRGVTPEELKTIPQSWFTDAHTPFPKVPIFGTEDELSRGVASVAKDFGLTREQKLQFIAKQLELIRIRNEAVKRYNAGLHTEDGLIPYPTREFQSERGGTSGTTQSAADTGGSFLNPGTLKPTPSSGFNLSPEAKPLSQQDDTTNAQ